MIGNDEATGYLRNLAKDSNPIIRLFAFRAAARFYRDDFLGMIRSAATHPHVAEKEGAIGALGIFQDMHSHDLLKKLAKSPNPNVRLAALQSLLALGDLSVKNEIMNGAAMRNLFAIMICAHLPESADVLAHLVHDRNLDIRLNSAIALLNLRDPRCLPTLYEALLTEDSDIAIMPSYSSGQTLMAWKTMSSASCQSKRLGVDLPSYTLRLQEQFLSQSANLPESAFLALARHVFNSSNKTLIPLLTSLLENHKSEQAIKLLVEMSEKAGAPLTRTYCHLSLHRLKKEDDEALRKWALLHRNQAFISFRKASKMPEQTKAPFELTPDETSNLL